MTALGIIVAFGWEWGILPVVMAQVRFILLVFAWVAWQPIWAQDGTGKFATNTVKSTGAGRMDSWFCERKDLNGADRVYPRAQVIALREFGIPDEIDKTTGRWTYRKKEGAKETVTELSFCSSGKDLSSYDETIHDGNSSSGLLISSSHCGLCADDKKHITDLDGAREAYKLVQGK